MGVARDDRAMMVFTSEQAADLLNVSESAVNRWFDAGQLQGYRIPGTEARRIPRKYLADFLAERGIRITDLEE